MSALKPEDNACIACVASVVCLTMERPFEGGRMEEAGISGCTQYYCPECYYPWVVRAFRHLDAKPFEYLDAERIYGLRAPRAKKISNSECCKECVEVSQCIAQVNSYYLVLGQRRAMVRDVGQYIVSVDHGSTTSDAICVCSAMDTSTNGGNNEHYKEYLMGGDLANCVAERETPMADLVAAHDKAILKLQELRERKKARKQANLHKYWGGRKP